MSAPRLKVPPKACDTHIHVFEDRFPLIPHAVFKPAHSPASEYKKIQQQLGLERVIVVQPNGYGFDNRCTLEAMATLGAGARGIAIVPPDVTDQELARLTGLGIRGVRYFMLPGGNLSWETLEPMAKRVADHGWLVQLQLDGRELPKYEAIIKRLPVPVIIDHNGKFLEPVPATDPSFQCFLRLLGTGRVWAKLAAPYETSKVGAPHYDDVSALSRALTKENPDRCLWATNWPHPNTKPVPDNAKLLDLLLECADSDATRQKILVDNPAALYGYDKN
jgi:D-galactarolactone isomerase